MTNETIDPASGEPAGAIPADFGPPLERVLAFDANAHAPARPAASGDAASAPVDLAFEGTEAFAEALARALRHAVAVGARRLCWCDPDFVAWPLGDAPWVEQLTRWARSGTRELVMVASGYEALARAHPRFAVWRRDFAHVVRCLVPEDAQASALPTLWLDDSDQVMRVFDPEHWRGRIGFGRVDRQQIREEFDAIAQRATAGFATVTLGL